MKANMTDKPIDLEERPKDPIEHMLFTSLVFAFDKSEEAFDDLVEKTKIKAIKYIKDQKAGINKEINERLEND